MSIFKKLKKLAPHKVIAKGTNRALTFGTNGKGFFGKANPLNPIQATGGVLRTVYSGKGPLSRNFKANLALTREAHQIQENASGRKYDMYAEARRLLKSPNQADRARGQAMLKGLDKGAHRQAVSKGSAAVAAGVIIYSAGSLASGASGGSAGATGGASSGATAGGSSTLGYIKTGASAVKAVAGAARALHPVGQRASAFPQNDTLPVTYDQPIPYSMRNGMPSNRPRPASILDVLFDLLVPKRGRVSVDQPSRRPGVPGPIRNPIYPPAPAPRVDTFEPLPAPVVY